jgi:hypothetical protein
MKFVVANRPDRVLRLLTTLASIAYYGAWVGAVLVLAAAPPLKLLAPDDMDWEWGLPVPVTVTNTEAMVRTSWGPARLEVEDVRGDLRLPIAMLPWWLFALLWIHFAFAAALMLTFLHNLRRVFQTARDGAPFDADNGPRLWWLGLTLIGLVAVNSAAGVFTRLAVSRGLASEDITVSAGGLHADGWLLFFAIVLVALAQVFRRGTQLEEDQSLTV